ncbi:MFS transporter [Tritonibacter scottomollicae]|uniref:MFS transporter n=1 Tax=Tritonibacter scottomollicae TaxID=483013 RepID=UPI003AA7AC32
MSQPIRFHEFLLSNAPYLSAGVLLTFLSSFGQTFFVSVFAGQIQTEFDLSHAGWGGLYMVGTTASALLMVAAGGLSDIMRVRHLGAFVLCGLSAACLLMALNHSYWVLPLSIFALRFFGQGMSTHLAVVAMARWFVAARGRALSIAALGVALGQALLPLIFVALMTILDWRTLWLVSAAVCLIGAPVLVRLLSQERTPQSSSKDVSSTGMDNRHWTRWEALRSPVFWLMVPSILGPAAFTTAFFFHQLHFATTKGWTLLELVAYFPFFTVMSVVSMLVAGWALDRWGATRLMPLYQLPLVAAFVIFATVSSGVGMAAGFLCMAASVGAHSVLPSSFWAEVYGTRNIGAIKALVMAVMVFGTAIGPGLTGLLIDLGIDFGDQGYGIAVYFLLTTLCMVIGVTGARKRLTPVAA